MSEILKESERFKEIIQPGAGEQEQPAQEEQVLEAPGSQDVPAPQPQEIAIIQQSDNPIILENNTTTPKKRLTDERIAKMYYLNPGQDDKLDDLRREYKRRTGKKLSEQNFMRMVVDKLTIDMLL